MGYFSDLFSDPRYHRDFTKDPRYVPHTQNEWANREHEAVVKEVFEAHFPCSDCGASLTQPCRRPSGGKRQNHHHARVVLMLKESQREAAKGRAVDAFLRANDA